MFSTKPSTTPNPTAALTAQAIGWKWEVNHDGVIWSWYHPTPCYASSASASASLASSAPSALVPSALAPLPAPKENTSLSSPPLDRPTLVDYWYIVHDGVVIPHVNDW